MSVKTYKPPHPPRGCTPLALAQPHEDGPGVPEALADAIGVGTAATVASLRLPDIPKDGVPLSNEAVIRIVGQLMPESAIISDETVTAVFPYYDPLDTVAPCDYLQFTSGSVGDGIPPATGAAVACPDRKVISLEGDGSAVYTLQALSTQAREKLDVSTIAGCSSMSRYCRLEVPGSSRMPEFKSSITGCGRQSRLVNSKGTDAIEDWSLYAQVSSHRNQTLLGTPQVRANPTQAQ